MAVYFNPDHVRNNPALHNQVCLYFSGLGTDLTTDYAAALEPATKNRCVSVLVHHSDNGIDAMQSADDIYQLIDPSETGKTFEVASIGGSMGGNVAYETLSHLTQEHPNVIVRGFFALSSPTGSIDTKGPLEGAIVESGAFLHDKPIGFGVVATAAQYSIETTSRLKNLGSPLQDNYAEKASNSLQFSDISHVVNGTPKRLYLSQLQIIRDFTTKSIKPDFLNHAYTSYIRTDQTDRDGVVYVDAAAANWQQIIPGMKIEQLPDVGHADPNVHPAAYIPAINQDLALAGMKTFQERQRIDSTSKTRTP